MVLDSPTCFLDSSLEELLEQEPELLRRRLQLQGWREFGVHCPPFLGKGPCVDLLMVEAPLPALTFCQAHRRRNQG